MKTILKKAISLNRLTLFRNIFVIIAFMAFYVIVLYILINSPA